MLTLRYNEPVFILMLRGRVGCLRQPTVRAIEKLDRLRSTMAVNVLIIFAPQDKKICAEIISTKVYQKISFHCIYRTSVPLFPTQRRLYSVFQLKLCTYNFTVISLILQVDPEISDISRQLGQEEHICHPHHCQSP